MVFDCRNAGLKNLDMELVQFIIGRNHKVLLYRQRLIEYYSVCPFVGIGTPLPPPLLQASVPPAPSIFYHLDPDLRSRQIRIQQTQRLRNIENLCERSLHQTTSTFSVYKKHSYHRVGRVLSFFLSRRNWDSLTPSTTGECPPPPVPGEGWGVGESQL